MVSPVFESYVDAMKEASEIIGNENPDFVLCPMLGSVPFIDAMAVVDDDFDPSKVRYMPASSRINDVTNVIKDWYYNFLKGEIRSPYRFPKVLGIDEVVSGSSVMRCLHHIDQSSERVRREVRQNLVGRVHQREREVALGAINELDNFTDNTKSNDLGFLRDRVQRGIYKTHPEIAREDGHYFTELVKEALKELLVYKTIGVEDSKKEGQRNGNYEDGKKSGRVIPVKVARIITMDKPEFCPATFQRKKGFNPDGYAEYTPIIGGFNITPEYVHFLRSLAKYVGKNPDNVSPVNMSEILESKRYLTR